jgi:hypothetical protein
MAKFSDVDHCTFAYLSDNKDWRMIGSLASGTVIGDSYTCPWHVVKQVQGFALVAQCSIKLRNGFAFFSISTSECHAVT